VRTRGAAGNILINTQVAPSPIVTVSLGETLNLYFGNATWSGGLVDLYMSRDGYASLTIPGDTRFGPTFSVADIRSTSIKQITEGDLRYTVGQNSIKATIPQSLEIPGGKYYIKAFAGVTGGSIDQSFPVAVTDNYLMIRASFKVDPAYGLGQVPIKLEGFALPPNDFANLSYDDGTD